MTGKELAEKYKDLFINQFFGFEHGEGWNLIVEGLLDEIKHTNERLIKDRQEPIRVVQIKEKFGGLRFYTDGAPDNIRGAIDLAEFLSYRTCEICGDTKTAKSRGNSWIITLCNNCWDERNEKKSTD